MAGERLCIRRLAAVGLALCVTFATGCKVADGLRQRVFANQFTSAACEFLTDCGIYPSQEQCVPAQNVPLEMDLLTDCPCYDSNAARDCVEALEAGGGDCSMAAQQVEFPEACERVCCPDSCEAEACEFFRLDPEDKCQNLLGTGPANIMRERLHMDVAQAECFPINVELPTCHFDTGLLKRLPEPALAANLLYYGRGPLAGDLDVILPCGDRMDELVLCASSNTEPGDHYVLVYETEEPLVRTHPANLYELGFVFDGDENAENNFQPTQDFANDFFENTDQWFEAKYSPITGWSIRALVARMMTVVENTESAARIVIRDNVVALVVPVSELPGFDPAARVTLFRHTGDYGTEQPFDWAGQVFPIQHTPLANRILRRPF